MYISVLELVAAIFLSIFSSC